MWVVNERVFEQTRRQIAAGDPAAHAVAEYLRAQAEALCGREAPAVTDKSFTPHSPSRDPHDYVSIGTYWWPNPDTEDGLPYLRRDGCVRSDAGLYDRPRWDQAVAGMIAAIRAAVVLSDTQYALEAVRRLRRWFLEPDTRMTPHLRYAQMIPGCRTGSPLGIIDFALSLPMLLDHVTLLARMTGSPWTYADQHALTSWCRDFLTWLDTHDYGRLEGQAANNHGTFYDRLVVTLALFLDQPAQASSYLPGARNRIASQIAPDGRMPHELDRSCSFGYTLMNTHGFLDLAGIGRTLGTELWSWATDDGRSLKTAVDFLYQHACSHDAWPYEQIEPIDWRMVSLLLTKANRLAGDIYRIEEMAHRLPTGFDVDAFAVLEPIHPFGRERSPAVGLHECTLAI